ncbi:unnamed protein product [Cyprideis torosa]|uniref:Uncharacterized protein n=1 Tax=Cyprideis torosa TaxID=163714 RepID=A0A7R8WC17_9CRUS|nr:unnamed protein product [Cyprideis torosa]CAG0892711.1 unnamed protein product [Cyprideis torosa]
MSEDMISCLHVTRKKAEGDAICSWECTPDMIDKIETNEEHRSRLKQNLERLKKEFDCLANEGSIGEKASPNGSSNEGENSLRLYSDLPNLIIRPVQSGMGRRYVSLLLPDVSQTGSQGSKGDVALSLLQTIPSDVLPNRKNNGGSPVQHFPHCAGQPSTEDIWHVLLGNDDQ